MSTSDPPSRSRALGSPEHVDRPGTAEPLHSMVRQAVEEYFRNLDGHDASGLFELVMTEVEVPLLETTLAHAGGNQSRAAAMLGINRATLRKKLMRYGLV